MKQIDLSSVHGCQQEIQDCSRGLAYLDHIFSRAVDQVSDRQAIWEAEESKASAAARANAPKAATATEIKGLITEWVNDRPSARQARDELRHAENTKEKVERYMRSLEKRLSAAQSALNGHQSLGRYGGGE